MKLFIILYFTVVVAIIAIAVTRITFLLFELKRLKQATVLLKRLQPIITSANTTTADYKEILEVLHLLEDIPNNFAISLATEKVVKLERVLKIGV